MDQSLFAAVDGYIDSLFLSPDAELDAALKLSDDKGLPEIYVSPIQGKFLMMLAKLIGAKRILEIGTLGGYSTIWLARALPKEGSLVTLEYEPMHAEVARTNLQNAGLSDCVEVVVGKAVETLPTLAGAEPFDMVFIDANKEDYAEYLDWSLRLTRPGGLILADNVVREGNVLDADSDDPLVQGVRAFNEKLAADDRAEAMILQQIGEKGYDGMAVIRRL